MITISPTSFNLTSQVGGPTQRITLTVYNSSSKAVNVTWSDSIHWLQNINTVVLRVPPRGSAQYQIDVVPAGLAVGTYSGTVTLSFSGGAIQVPMHLTIVNTPAPTVTITPPNLNESRNQGDPRFTDTVIVRNTGINSVQVDPSLGAGSLIAAVSAGGTIAPNATLTFIFTIDPDALSPGTYQQGFNFTVTDVITRQTGTVHGLVSLSVAGGGGGLASFNWVSFDAGLRTNGDSNGFPASGFPSPYTAEGFSATIQINSTDSVDGGHSLQVNATNNMYLQFNMANDLNVAGYPQHFLTWARNYADSHFATSGPTDNPNGWLFNTYTKLKFWIKIPTNGALVHTDGDHNWEVGVYNKNISTPDYTSDEYNGMHYYFQINPPPTGTWVQVILPMHPDHIRGGAAGVESGYLPYPTSTLQRGLDPDGVYNFWDTLTRIYINQVYGLTPTAPFLFDSFVFYQDDPNEDDVYVRQVVATYVASTNRIYISWNRPNADDGVNWDVKYAFSDIRTLGYANATAAPGGSNMAPPGSAGFNGVVYDETNQIAMGGNPYIWFALKSQGSSKFSQAKIPLTIG